MSSSAKETIIGTIQKALRENQLPMPFPEAEKQDSIYPTAEHELEEKFAIEFSALGGKFVYCADEAELCEQLQALADTLKWNKIHCKDQSLLHLFADYGVEQVQEGSDMHDIEVGISLCEKMIARTGSVILSSAQAYGRALPVYAPIHITVGYNSQLVWDIGDGIQSLQKQYGQQFPSMLTLTTGPSRTADIEKTLVVGVHGPKEVYVFLVDQPLPANR